MKRAVGFLVGLLLLAGCGSARTFTVSAGADYTPPHGAYNPAVTQVTIRSTICVSGWTKTVRPSVGYTNALKVKQMKVRHLPGTTADYEEDHFVPLELGGAPSDPTNLWPEPRNGAHASASAKDRTENALKVKVCSGALTLAQARLLVVNPAQWGKP